MHLNHSRNGVKTALGKLHRFHSGGSARLYGVQTFRFNEAVKRNQARFPDDFRFQLGKEEFESLTSQIAITKPAPGRGGRRTLPWAFTEAW